MSGEDWQKFKLIAQDLDSPLQATRVFAHAALRGFVSIHGHERAIKYSKRFLKKRSKGKVGSLLKGLH